MTPSGTVLHGEADAMWDGFLSSAGIALYLGVVVTLALAMVVSPWLAAIQAAIIGPLVAFAWLTR